MTLIDATRTIARDTRISNRTVFFLVNANIAGAPFGLLGQVRSGLDLSFVSVMCLVYLFWPAKMAHFTQALLCGCPSVIWREKGESGHC